jgi:hypothetical protein
MADVYLMCVRTERDAECSCQTKISKLDVAVAVNQKVLGLQVSVKQSVGVAESNSL